MDFRGGTNDPSHARRRIGRWLVAAFALSGGAALGLWSTTPDGHHKLDYSAQDPETSCGPVSLAIVGQWLGSPTSIGELNRFCRMDEGGISSLLDLIAAALRMGLAAEAVRINPDRPIAWDLPMILHINNDHFAACLPVGGNDLILADPPRPPERISRGDLLADWKGIALVVAPSETQLKAALRASKMLK